MVTKVIDEVSFELKEDFDFSFLSQYGSVFTVFDKQDSGNLCFGVKDGDRKLFLKIAGTSTTKSRASKEEAIDRLISTITIYEDLQHPNLIQLIDHKPIDGGYLAIFEWFDGACMGRQYSSFDKFIALPINEKLCIYNDILVFHQHVHICNYVAIDFYDGCIMYDFEKHRTMICDIEFYHKKPYFNPIGRMWGSSQHMSPEEFQLGAEIDERSNVFLMGATAFQLFGGGRDRALDKWSAGKHLFNVASKAINADRNLRYPSIDAYISDWKKSEAIGILSDRT